MPLYEYECKSCGNIQEVLQKISDPAPEACTNCGASTLSKVMSLTSFQLKGTGWYVTDFRDGGKKPQTDSAKEKVKGSGKDKTDGGRDNAKTGKTDAKGEASSPKTTGTDG